MYKYIKRVFNIIIPLTSLWLSTENSSESSTLFQCSSKRMCCSQSSCWEEMLGMQEGEGQTTARRYYIYDWRCEWTKLSYERMQTGYENDEILQMHNQIWILNLLFMIKEVQRLQWCCVMMNFETKTTASCACIIEFTLTSIRWFF